LALFGLAGLDDISHALFWSLLANVGGYVALSLLGRQSVRDRAQAQLFVDVFKREGLPGSTWRGSASVQDVAALLSDDEVEAIQDRAATLVTERVLPTDHTGHRYPWPLV